MYISNLVTKIIRLIIFRLLENYDIDLITPLISLPRKIAIWQFKRFITNPVLIIEPTDSHGETIPAVFKYFKDLNLKSDILMLDKHRDIKSIDCIKKYKPNAHYVSYYELSTILESEILNKYKIIFFNSFNTYFSSGKEYPSIYKQFNISNINSFVWGFLHHLDYKKECQNNNYHYFALTNLKNEYSNENNFINPHYFGDIKITSKNKLTKFIIVGAFESDRRNIQVLIDATKKLIKNGFKNFRITCIGRNAKNNLSSDLSKYFEFKGKLPYPEMYKEMNKSDFFLPLLDPDNPEHDRYITIGTSGSFQLIYGFKKPCLIHKKFAKHHFLNNENSIIYSKNEDLYNAMKQAIEMDENEYQEKQSNLKKLANDLYKKSLENLKNALKERGYDG